MEKEQIKKKKQWSVKNTYRKPRVINPLVYVIYFEDCQVNNLFLRMLNICSLTKVSGLNFEIGVWTLRL